MVSNFITNSADKTVQLGELLGNKLLGGEVMVLASDLGGGKTTFVRGLAKGFGSEDHVASPTFVINFVYNTKKGQLLKHYDFYRLNDPGIIKNELEEALEDDASVVIIEWAEVVEDVLPKEAIRASIKSIDDNSREFTFKYNPEHEYLFRGLEGVL